MSQARARRTGSHFGRHVCLLAATAAVVFLSIASPAFAATGFGLTGRSWPNKAMSFRINANCSASGVDEAALVSLAASNWNAAGSPFRFIYAGPTSGPNVLGNGVSEIYWTTAGARAGIPAQAQISYDPITGRISEVDIAFSATSEWHWGDGSNGTLDVASVAVHELGHALSLSDLYGDVDRPNVMYGVITIGARHRLLGAGDIAGIRAMYGTGAPDPASQGAATLVTIRSSATSVYQGRPFVLSGVLSPGAIGDPVVVYVKKPYKAYWSYSSKRLCYSAASPTAANWWYRYTPYARTSPRGVYYFKAAFEGAASRGPAVSGTVKVTVR